VGVSNVGCNFSASSSPAVEATFQVDFTVGERVRGEGANERQTPFEKSPDSPNPVHRQSDFDCFYEPRDTRFIVVPHSPPRSAGHAQTTDSESPATITKCVSHSGLTGKSFRPRTSALLPHSRADSVSHIASGGEGAEASRDPRLRRSRLGEL